MEKMNRRMAKKIVAVGASAGLLALAALFFSSCAKVRAKADVPADVTVGVTKSNPKEFAAANYPFV